MAHVIIDIKSMMTGPGAGKWKDAREDPQIIHMEFVAPMFATLTKCQGDMYGCPHKTMCGDDDVERGSSFSNFRHLVGDFYIDEIAFASALDTDSRGEHTHYDISFRVARMPPSTSAFTGSSTKRHLRSSGWRLWIQPHDENHSTA